jgi:hypothetical protein
VDGTNWGAWTPVDEAAIAPYSQQIDLGTQYGYYEFYSTATDSQGSSESAPFVAEASTHYVPQAPYNSVAIVQLSKLNQVYNGAALPVVVTTTPPSLATTVTYNSGNNAPVHPGNYTVDVSVTQPGFTGSTSGTLVISKAAQTIQWPNISPVAMGVAPFALAASTSSGLPITSYVSGNASVATVAGGVVTVLGVGTTSITATQIGNGDYLAATPASMDLVVSPPTAQVPAMPIWAIVALLGFIILAGVRVLIRDAANRTC